MSTLFISEFQYPADGTLGAANAAGWVTDQHFTVSASNASSQPFNALTHFVLLSADTACSISWTLPGAANNPATAGSLYIPANAPPVGFAVLPGMTVSAITNT